METKNIIFLIVLITAFGMLFYSLRKVISYLKVGLDENRCDNVGKRILNVLKIAFGQSKILRDPTAGPVHFLIFWGFMVFLLAVIEALIQGVYSPFSLEILGILYLPITFILDLFSVLVILAVVVALVRRYIIKVERLDRSKHAQFDATLILSLILIVVITMLGQSITHLAGNDFITSENEYKPISLFLSKIFYSSRSNTNTLYEVFWWTHIVTIFGFMNYLPYSKHFHVFSSIPNVFLSKFGENKYSLKSLDLEDENIEQFGASDIEHLSWKQLLDGYTCTECGRCTDVCPAANTGKKLSPRDIIVNIRKRTQDKAPLIASGVEQSEVLEKTLIHDYITDEEIWACTTCNACVYECPVTIEHLDSIVDLRRNLVLMESQFPNELNTVFKNLETNFSPWAFNSQDRANWADGLGVKTMAEDQDCEVLFWVGCAGSFDARYQKVSVAFTKILQKAGIDFRILGTEEKCNGDTARRLGNEYLAQMMMQENVELLNNYKVKKIVTGCPHCFNSIKNEFPQFGGNYEVLHHSQFIKELIDTGKIKTKVSEEKKITFHDSCYLGRYNSIYSEPRDIIKNIEGAELVEMDRSFDKGFCCGAGGGRMFLEEIEGTRINEERTKEALNTGADTITSACPFCMTMMSDGVKSFEKEEEVDVKDIAEIVLENLE